MRAIIHFHSPAELVLNRRGRRKWSHATKNNPSRISALTDRNMHLEPDDRADDCEQDHDQAGDSDSDSAEALTSPFDGRGEVELHGNGQEDFNGFHGCPGGMK